MNAALRALLAAPGGGTLTDDGEDLVAADGRRFQVVDGIPVLLSSGDPRGRREIVDAFRERSATYHDANYAAGRNPQREYRQALVVELLADAARPGATLLDAGAGPAILGEAARALGLEYVALDLSLDNLLAGRARVGELAAVVGDLTAIPLRSDAVDGALAIGSLEYVPELSRAVAELCRVVAPGGFVIATFASSRSPRRWWDEGVVARAIRLRAAVRGGAPYRRYLHSTASVRALFERAGAEIVDVRYANAGLLGYPFSEVRPLAALDARVTPRTMSSEFVIYARRALR